MKVKDVKTFAVGNPPPHHGGPVWIFVTLTTDTGIKGVGEVYGVPFDPHVVAKMTEDVAEQHIVGADPFQIEKLWRIVYSRGYLQRPDVSLMGVMSGIEMALWDIIGKALNQPVYNLLGGLTQETLRSYTYLYADSDTPPDNPMALTDVHNNAEVAAARAAHYISLGFTAVKYDPIMPMSAFDPRELSIETLDNAEAVTAALRDAVGSGVDLLFGTHGQCTTASAIRLAQRIEPYEPLWFEEPVPPENIDEMARVCHSTSVPVATGERLTTKYEFAQLLGKQAASILQPALGRVGGILEAKKIAGMAEAHYVRIAPHLYCGPIEAAANIQVAACSSNFLIQESIERFDGFHATILEQPIRWQDGRILPPSEPGLGVVLDEAVAEAHPYEGGLFPEMVDRPL